MISGFQAGHVREGAVSSAVEHWFYTPLVGSSILSPPTNAFGAERSFLWRFRVLAPFRSTIDASATIRSVHMIAGRPMRFTLGG
jgi:hypothetical protein